MTLELPASDDVIIDELVADAQTAAGRHLIPFRSYAGAHQYRRLYRTVRRWIPGGSSVLDWGVASGHFSYFLRRAGYRAVGFSIEDLTFAPLVDDDGYRFVRGPADEPTALPFSEAELGAVVSVGVLEHVSETGGSERASLKEIARILAPGGVFICYHFPNLYGWVETIASLLPNKQHHGRRYRKRDIVELVAGAGLELAAVERYGFMPRNSWSRLPQQLRLSKIAATLYDWKDQALSLPLRPMCTYFQFVAIKRR